MKSESIQIPPGRKTYNSNVEAAHRLIEDEFYDVEDYCNRRDFLNKAFAYSVYFNYLRKFRYKGKRTLLEIMTELNEPKICLPKIGIFYPIITDHYLNIISKGVYHVPISDIQACVSLVINLQMY